jgi:glycosyltransferase involved in cell wall biosynthesis
MTVGDGDRGLVVELDVPLPEELAVGAGTAVFVCGTCFHLDAAITALSFVVGGDRRPVSAYGMPRLDKFRSLHPTLDAFATAGLTSDAAAPGDPLLHSYRSGFWGNVPIGPVADPGVPLELHLEARLADGRVARRRLARFAPPAAVAPVAPPPVAPGPLVAIAMATYQPPMELFRRQIESIRAQTHAHWICVLSDDGSDAEHLAAMRAHLGDDPRFVLSRSPRRLGFYRNFERALELIPAHAEFVALADQDDIWDTDKLAVLLGSIGDARLAYSDARIVTDAGTRVSDTYWVTRRHNHERIEQLLLTNSVTGAASLMRREVLDDALPFPPAQFVNFHDHWLALIALAGGAIVFVDRPLYDYVQHGDATLGHAKANRMPRLRERLGNLAVSPRRRASYWRRHYFVDVCRLQQWAGIVLARRGPRIDPVKRRHLERFRDADRSLLTILDMWRLGGLELLGRGQTLGAEWMLAYALTWRWLLDATVRDRPVRRLRLDAVPPEQFTLMPKPPPVVPR